MAKVRKDGEKPAIQVGGQIRGALVDAAAEHPDECGGKPFAERQVRRVVRGLRGAAPRGVEKDARHDHRDSAEAAGAGGFAEDEPPHEEGVDQAGLDDRPDNRVRPPLHRPSHEQHHEVVEESADEKSADNQDARRGRAAGVREKGLPGGGPAGQTDRHARGAAEDLVEHKTVAAPLDVADDGADGHPAEPHGDEKEKCCEHGYMAR